MFLICYCDYGDIVVINSDRLKVLPASFRQLPALAISARLSGKQCERCNDVISGAIIIHRVSRRQTSEPRLGNGRLLTLPEHDRGQEVRVAHRQHSAQRSGGRRRGDPGADADRCVHGHRHQRQPAAGGGGARRPYGRAGRVGRFCFVFIPRIHLNYRREQMLAHHNIIDTLYSVAASIIQMLFYSSVYYIQF